MFIERRFYNGPMAVSHHGPAQFDPPAGAHAGLGGRHRRAGTERKRLLKEGVSDLVLAEGSRQGWRLPSEKVLEVFALDIELNALGLESWLDSEGK